MATSDKIAHLQMIQEVIKRLATNSFLIKGWSVGLASALFALAVPGRNDLFALLAYFPIFAFWVLDGYFLWKERQYRALFDAVRNSCTEATDFSMSGTPASSRTTTWRRSCFSTTLVLFHGTLVVSVVVIMTALRYYK